MKKLLLLLTLIFLMFTGCKKDAVEAKLANSLTGKWYAKQSIITNYNVTPANTTIVNVSGQNDYIQFNADGTGEVNTFNGTLPMKYAHADKTIVITYNSTPNSPRSYAVSQFTSSTLVLSETKKDNAGKTTEIIEVSYSKQ